MSMHPELIEEPKYSLDRDSFEDALSEPVVTIVFVLVSHGVDVLPWDVHSWSTSIDDISSSCGSCEDGHNKVESHVFLI